MKHKRRIKGPVLSVLMGIFCFVLLTVMLYGTQIAVSYQLQYEDAMTELTRLQDQLSSQPHQEGYDQIVEDLLRNIVQKTALLLTDEEISNQTLAAVVEQLPEISTAMVFREDGTLMGAFGNAKTDPDFLRQLQESHIEKAENNMSFLAMRFRDDLYLAIGTSIYALEDGFPKQEYDMRIVAELSVGMSGNTVIVNRANGRVLYGPESMLGRRLSEFMLSPAEIASDFPMLLIDHSIYFLVRLRHENYQLLSLISLKSIIQNLNNAIIPALLGFGFLIVLLLAYTEFIRMDMCKGWLGKIHYVQFGKKHYVNTLLLRKLAGFAVIGIACMICVIYCIQLLVRSDEQRQNAEYRLDIAARILEENKSAMAEAKQMDIDHLTDMAQEVKSILTFNSSLFNEAGMNSIARLLNVDGICVLDENGKAVAATTNFQNYELSSNISDAAYPFWSVINGFAASHVQSIPNDPYNQDNDMVYAGIVNDHERGMILLATHNDSFKMWQQLYDPTTTLGMVGLDSQSILLAVKSGSTSCVFDSSSQYTGLSLEEYGIEESFLRSGYSGTHRFDGKDSLITTRSILDLHLLYITPTGQISASSWLFTAYVVIIGLLVALLAIIPRLMVRVPGEDIRPSPNKARSARKRSRVDAFLDRDGQIELVESCEDTHAPRKRWKDKPASAKLTDLVRLLMAALGVWLLLFLLLNKNTGNHPLMDRILGQNWDQSLNVYAVSYVTIVVIGVWIVAGMLQNIIRFVMGTFSRRWKTSGILISNVLRYATLIFSVFFTLKNFGVQTSTLATSASLLTLIFGLGCQNFVADLVAGVFLLFEGAFRVGDIVTIDNWHGEVVEIGLRSTKVKNEIGNVKVFQNSRISGAVNMTRDLTFAVCDIPLPPGEMLEAYESKLTTSFFPEAMKNIELLRHPLVYEGVVNMTGDNAILRISVKCLEHDREQIKRELYRALKLWREETAKKPPANP